MKQTGVVMFGALLLGVLTASSARGENIVICDVGGISNTAQAAGAVENFLRHMEQAAGLPARSLSGEYHATAAGCEGYIKAKSPAYGVFDLATYLRLEQALKLVPMAHMGKADALNYHMVVKKGTATALDGLKGKTLVSTLHDPRFISRVVLGGKLDVDKDLKKFTVKGQSGARKALRDVFRGKVDGALVEGLVFSKRNEISSIKGDELASIYQSRGLPGLTMALIGQGAPASQVAKIKAAIPKLCSGPGEDLCKSFQISALLPAKASVYKDLAALY